MPIPAFLVEHPTAGPFMIDTGVAPAVAEGGTRADLGRVGGAILDVKMKPGQAAGDQLRERGFDPEGIRLVVMTHLHFDHAGGTAQFPDATFVVSRPEWDDPPSTLKGTYAHHRDQVDDWRTYELPEQPWEQFSRTVDLFGDGSVRLVATPGHTPGHVLGRPAPGRRADLPARRRRRVRAALARRPRRPAHLPRREGLPALARRAARVRRGTPRRARRLRARPWEWPSAVRELDA
jgi:ribonuclease BN (tRNA processing enzyme)